MSADDAERATWRTGDATTLDALLAMADCSGEELREKGVPWYPHHGLDITGWGGLHSHDAHRVTIAPGGYQSSVFGTRRVVVEDGLSLEVDGDLNESIGGDGGDGSDTLTVEGNADVAFHHKTTLMNNGTVNRLWRGGIVRYVGMEGVICAGIYTQFLIGGSATMSAVNSGDVYGGCARFSGARVYIAGINYRSVENVSWASAAYIRNTFVTIEPVIGSPAARTERYGMLRMAARLAMLTCPFLEIGAGLVMLPVGIALAIAALARGTPAKPPSGNPRLRQRNVLMEFRTRGSEMLI